MLTQVSTNVSDLHELIGGLPRVWVAVPETPDSTINEDKLNGSDKVPLMPCFAPMIDDQRCCSRCGPSARFRLWCASRLTAKRSCTSKPSFCQGHRAHRVPSMTLSSEGLPLPFTESVR